MENLIRDLKAICIEAESLALTMCNTLKGDMSSDMLFMCKSFSERQVSQMASLNLIADRDDVILIARSMFEGALYLCYSMKNNMCRHWRLFSIVIDKQRMERAVLNNEHVPDDIKDFINRLLPEADRLFKDKKGRYFRSWYGDKKIKDLARSVGDDFIYLYDEYYGPMSEYHHWGTASFGKRYKIEGETTVKIHSSEVDRDVVGSICMALSSLFVTLQISCEIFKIKAPSKMEDLKLKFKKLPGLSAREIKIKT
jgi:hypothetical protein